MASITFDTVEDCINNFSRSHINEAQRAPLTEEEIKTLVGFVSQTQDERILSKLFESFGDLARREVNRKVMTDNGVIEAAVPMLKHENEDIQTFAVRAIANLCFDTGSASADPARLRVEALDAVSTIVSMLSTSEDNTKRLRMVLGCIGNLASNTEHLALKLVELHVIPKLSQFINHPKSEVSSMALMAIGNTCVTDEVREFATKFGVFEQIVKKVKLINEDDLTQSLSALGVFLETKSIGNIFFDSMNGFDIIFNIVKKYENPQIDEDDVEDEEERQDLIDEYNGFIKSALSILYDLSQDDDEYRHKFLEHKAVDTLIEFVQKSSNLVVKEEASKVVSYLTLSDEINKKLFGLAEEFKKWIAHESTEIRMSAAMILGNLASDDATASQLIGIGVAQAMVAEIARNIDKLGQQESANMAEAAQNSEREGKEMRIKHLCISGLKNLSINPKHKSLLLEQNIMPKLTALLKQRNEIVAHAAITLIKSLFLAGPIAIQDYLQCDPFAFTMLTLTTRDEENKKDDHIFYEASRTIAVLINHANDEILKPFIEHYTPSEDEMIVIDGKRLVSPYTALSNLVFSKFTLLQSEGAAILLKLLESEYTKKYAPIAITSIPDLPSQLVKLVQHFGLGLTDEQLVRPTSAEVETFTPISLLILALLDSKQEASRKVMLSEETGLTKVLEELKGSTEEKVVNFVKKANELLA